MLRVFFFCFPYRLCKTADKLLGEAVKHRHSGDEEMSYINYMKYLTVVTMVQGLEEYKKEKAYFNQLLGPQKVNRALDMAEKLSGSLQQRWMLHALWHLYYLDPFSYCWMYGSYILITLILVQLYEPYFSFDCISFSWHN